MTILVIGFVEDHTLSAPFLRLAIAAERTVRRALETRQRAVRLVDTARPPFPDIVEAIESDDPAEWIVGMQWHPEHSEADPVACDRVFDAFVHETNRHIAEGVHR